MTHVIVGMGEIGSALYRILNEDHQVITYDISYSGVTTTTDETTLHVCFPYSANFVKHVNEYIKLYKPTFVIVYSTVAIGTCEKIDSTTVHSPVEGKHPDLEKSIRIMTRWVATSDDSAALYFCNLFESLGMSTKRVMSSRYTEALKLLSTSEYGVNIVFAALKAKVAKEIQMDYVLTKEWNEEYNRLYRLLGYDNYRKYVLDAPTGPIGGHCVRENSILLDEDFPDDMLKAIYNMKGHK